MFRTLAEKVKRFCRARLDALRGFPGTEQYWERRYAEGGDSGPGSFGNLARFKAEILNQFVRENGIGSVIEFGCGDGNQLSLADYPRYLGVDISPSAVEACRKRFQADSSKSFCLLSDYQGQTADLALSLDVIYHLVEDEIFLVYMNRLFDASDRFVIIYSSDSQDNTPYEGTYIRQRKFTAWVQENRSDWKLIQHIPNRFPYTGDCKEGSISDFYIYQKPGS